MKVFVYGTLLPGLCLHGLMRDADWVDHAFIEDADLFDLGEYPAMVSGKGWVAGEVYEVNDDILSQLDRAEGFLPENPDHSLYIRRMVTAWGLDGEIFDAAAYFYNAPVGEEAIAIPDGDYRRYLLESDPEQPLWLIAYGSNMSRRRLESRVGKVGPCLAFRLAGYALCFNKEGARANLRRESDASVPVTAWLLNRQQLQRLDVFEGTPEHYHRLGITVRLEGKWQLMEVYLAHPDRLEPEACPDPEYLSHILTGYREQGFDDRELLDRLGQIGP